MTLPFQRRYQGTCAELGTSRRPICSRRVRGVASTYFPREVSRKGRPIFT